MQFLTDRKHGQHWDMDFTVQSKLTETVQNCPKIYGQTKGGGGAVEPSPPP